MQRREINVCVLFFFSVYFFFLVHNFIDFALVELMIILYSNCIGFFAFLLHIHQYNLVKSTDSLGNHLNNLLRDAENRVQELSGIEDTPQAPFSTRASFSSIIGMFVWRCYFSQGKKNLCICSEMSLIFQFLYIAFNLTEH